MLREQYRTCGCSWEVRSSRPVTYNVIETTNILEPSNPTLISASGGGASSRRFVALDQALIESLADRLKKYFAHYGVSCHVMPVAAGERNKDLKNFQQVAKALDEFAIWRRCEPIVAFGGGVVTDLVGFVASCYRRGLPYVRIPTTLMGYVDASVGIKNGLNFNGSKNRIGSFAAPVATLLDKTFLRTLTPRHIRNGVGEIVKLAVIKDLKLFEDLERSGPAAIEERFQHHGDDLLRRSVRGMLEELEPNLYENNLERAMDFGHTFSPALEMSNLDGLLHGEAVAIDVAFSSVLSYVRGMADERACDRILRLSRRLGLPTTHTEIRPPLLWRSLQERTAHRGGLQRVPLIEGIGRCAFVNDITLHDLEDACRALPDRAAAVRDDS